MEKITNVLSLFDGLSCGQIALKELGVKVDKYYASEIDKHAIKQTMLNFPDTIQLGSVMDVDVSKLDKIDLLIGGSPCVAAGTKVLTMDGYKTIEDIVVGDMVLTHKNRFMPVLRVGGKVETTFTLKAQGFVDVVCTKNHPFYARRKMFEYYKQSNGRNSRRMFLGDPEWVEAGDLKDDYYVCSNIQNGKCENKLNITDDEAYIIGRYIADGHTRKDLRYDYKKNGNKGHNGSRSWQLILSIGNHKVDAFCSNIKNTHYSCYKHGDSVHRIVFSNKRLVDIVEKLCGIGSVNKQFGEPIINLPNELLAIVLKGFLDGDGYFDGKNWNITTTSPILAMSISRVVSKLYGRHSNISFQKTNEYGKIMGRVVHLNDQYVIIFSENKVEKEKPKVIEDKIWSGVKSFKQNKIQKVYNIEVEEDNSYTANNFVVHNCTNFSFAGKRNGMSTTTNEEIYTLDRYLELKKGGFQFEGESFLFWEYMRILNDIRKYNPNVKFLLENVEMGKKWERTLSEAIGLFGVHINSALVSAQNRKRIFWTNIRTKQMGLFGEVYSDIPQPEDRGILLKDILEDGVDEKYYLSDKTTGSPTDQQLEPRTYGKTNTLTTVQKDNLIMQLNTSKESGGNQPYQQNRVYDINGIVPSLLAQMSCGAHKILVPEATKKGYAELSPGECFDFENPKSKTRRGRKMIEKSNSLMSQNMSFMNYTSDYRIRRLTPTECSRLQTIPEWYRWECSDTQAYKMLGNGWCVEVIKHIFQWLEY